MSTSADAVRGLAFGLPLDANYRRALRQDNPGSCQALSTVVHASGCASLLLYVLLYGVGTQVSGQIGQAPVARAWRLPALPSEIP